MKYYSVPNIERLELIEEKLGISFSGVGADLRETDSLGWKLSVRVEIIALNGGKLKESLWVKMSAFDSKGKCVATEMTLLDADTFFGIDAVEFTTYYLNSSDVQRVRIFAKKI